MRLVDTVEINLLETYAAIFHSVPAGVMMQIASGEIIQVNPRAEEILGLSLEQMVGRTSMDSPWQAVDANGSALSGEQIPSMLALSSGQPQRDVVMGFHRPDNTLVWLLVNAEPLFHEGADAAYAVVTTFTDISKQRASEKRLFVQNAVLEIQAESGDNAVLMVSDDGAWLYFNQTFLNFWNLPRGANAEALALEGWQKLLAQLKEPAALQVLIDDASNQNLIVKGKQLVLKDDRIFTLYSIPVHHPDSSLKGRLYQFRDFTQWAKSRQALQESEARYRLLADNATDVISLHDAEGNYLYVSPSVTDNLGYAPEELIGTNPQAITHPDDIERVTVELTIQSAADISPISITYRARHKEGHYLWFEARLKLEQDFAGWEMVIRNVHDKVMAELKIVQQNHDLKRSNEELQQFAYVASHDLQEPLRMVSSFMQLLNKRYRDQLDEKAQHYIDYAISGSQRMQTLIQDLLAFSRVGTRNQVMKLVSMEEVVAHTLANLRLLFSERQVQFSHDPLPSIRGNQEQLVQVMQNLFSNAIKFSPGQPCIYLSVKQSNNTVRFGVHDQGIGIAPGERERIFQVFQRLHGRDEYPGTGIGLAIVRKVIERHGGEIWVEDNTQVLEPSGKTRKQPKPTVTGSVFYFTLPHE